MKKRMKTLIPVLLAILTLGMVRSYSSEMSTAYFTTYAFAKGGLQIALGPTKNRIEDNYERGKKEVGIQNTGDEFDCYVRVKVLAPQWMWDDGILSDEGISGEGWSKNDEDGYWYYNAILKPGETSNSLFVTTDWMKTGEELEEFKQSCDVVIVDEFTMVRYDENGDPWADWKWEKGSDVK